MGTLIVTETSLISWKLPHGLLSRKVLFWMHLPTKFYDLTPTKTRAMTAHTFHRPPGWPQKPKPNNSRSSCQNVLWLKLLVNIGCHQPACQVSSPTDQQLRVICNLNIFNESCRQKPKNLSSSKLTGWVFSVTNCHKLSCNYHFKAIRPLKKDNFRFSALGLSRSTDFWSHPEIKNSTNKNLWKVTLTLQKP